MAKHTWLLFLLAVMLLFSGMMANFALNEYGALQVAIAVLLMGALLLFILVTPAHRNDIWYFPNKIRFSGFYIFLVVFCIGMLFRRLHLPGASFMLLFSSGAIFWGIIRNIRAGKKDGRYSPFQALSGRFLVLPFYWLLISEITDSLHWGSIGALRILALVLFIWWSIQVVLAWRKNKEARTLVSVLQEAILPVGIILPMLTAVLMIINVYSLLSDLEVVPKPYRPDSSLVQEKMRENANTISKEGRDLNRIADQLDYALESAVSSWQLHETPDAGDQEIEDKLEAVAKQKKQKSEEEEGITISF